ncbi:diaminopimelate decarboxylase [Rhizobium mesosinicum]|uniref:Diaminopimelate decarboxylase n=1 Tax=Rhizobium mesosinicum TaxID=335017 RepID=A0ABS7GRK7_9HYPH|nr:diaminopimelate decarboxylase [Rhizobium mesosinicum]MBW9052560.1 diaminopimelate decarboxylase [Rhizobium mesosinicum]
MPIISANHLTALTHKYGTPLWVYDAPTIRDRIRQLGAFDVIRYAQKACCNIHILSLMREAGVLVDSVSSGEIDRAQRAGFSTSLAVSGAADIIYTADIFDRPTLRRVVNDKVEVNIGSIDMLHQLGELSPGHRVWLRVNPGFGHGHSNKTNTGGENSKHGIWHGELKQAVELVRRYGLHLVGLHLHIGSGVDYGHLEQVCHAMTDLLGDLDHDVEAISAGGGLSVPYRDGDRVIDTAHYFSLWDSVRKQAESRLGHAVRLEIEPGRFLVAEAGLLLAEVRATKQAGRNHFTLVDAGFNDLMRPALYGSYHEISVLPRDGRSLSPSELRPTVVAGPLCESGDVFTQGADGVVETRALPPAEVGDLLVFHRAGAYGASMSSNYNSRPHAAEYLIDGTNSRLIRRRQTIDELFKMELISSHPAKVT